MHSTNGRAARSHRGNPSRPCQAARPVPRLRIREWRAASNFGPIEQPGSKGHITAGSARAALGRVGRDDPVGYQPESGHHVRVDRYDLVLRAADPGTQRPAVEGGIIGVDHPVRHTDDDHAPAEMLGQVDRVGLVGDYGAGLGPQLRGDRGRAVGADDDVVAIDQMADRADGWKRPRGEHDPAQRDAPQQAHGLLRGQLFQPPLVIRHRSPLGREPWARSSPGREIPR